MTLGHNQNTKHYWKLTPHIIRYGHFDAGTTLSLAAHGIHTADEHMLPPFSFSSLSRGY